MFRFYFGWVFWCRFMFGCFVDCRYVCFGVVERRSEVICFMIFYGGFYEIRFCKFIILVVIRVF